MFEQSEEKKSPALEEAEKSYEKNTSSKKSNMILGIIPWNKSVKIILFIFLAFGFVILMISLASKIDFSFFNKKEPEIVYIPEPEENLELDNNVGLPVNPDLPSAKEENLNQDLNSVEYLSFADFYKKPELRYEFEIADYNLPLQVKTDVENYYTISRKLFLDNALDDLNNNGYAFLPNFAGSLSNDFYSSYKWLQINEVPIMITSDFVLYYYQYNLKKIFKDIESSVFYDNLWEINKDLYENAKLRYESHLRETGDINDPVLEGKRLVTAYLATILEILKPSQEQIDEEIFTPQEVIAFNFNLPKYLEDDVLREVELIRGHSKKEKSPVLLYERDYSEFFVPNEYKSNARLNNFYLTTKWLNSVFPLYSKDDCSDCLLDKNDWRVNMVAAQYLSQDFSNNPTVKAKWARIYKVISFFKGLRSDLTYVHYRDDAKRVFGDNYDIEETFSPSNSNFDNNFKLLQSEIRKNNFLSVQGAYDLRDKNNYLKVGLRVLADSYWPNSYIFSELTYPKVGNAINQEIDSITSCNIEGEIKRCNGFGLDIVSLVGGDLNGQYWEDNTDYINYSNSINSLRTEMNKNTPWQENNYWSNLNILNDIFSSDNSFLPVFARNSSWKERENSLALGSWANFQLPIDKLDSYSVYKKEHGIGEGENLHEYNYIEPDLALYDSLLSNVDMISQMFLALKMHQEVNSTVFSLSNMRSDLEQLKLLAQKQLIGEDLTEDDADFIFNFSRRNILKEKNSINYIDIPGYNSNNLRVSVDGVKLLALIRNYKGSPVLVVGPVFNYKEK
ncbi:DUF3160 domain-containing protein [bacterium]|nr:DUF3160 domain-containing protein [bacterium]